MTKRNKNEAKFKAWFNATSIKGLSILKRAAIEIASFVLASVAAYIIVVYGKAILIIFFELTSLLSNNGASNDAPALASSKPFEGARNIAFALTALVGGPFLVWRTILADRQTKTAQEQTTITQEKVSIDEQTHYTTLYIKSIELLGATRVVKTADGKERTERAMELRLGAIYALERIAQDSWKDHWPIMEVLTAYIRENSPYQEGVEPKKISNDIQAIMDVIGRRNEKWRVIEKKEKKQLNLSECNFHDLAVSAGSDFTDTSFAKSYLVDAYFDETNLTKCRFDSSYLNRAYFNKCKFEQSIFRDALMHETMFNTCLIAKTFCTIGKGNCSITKCIYLQTGLPNIAEKCNVWKSLVDIPSLDIDGQKNELIVGSAITDDQIDRIFTLLKAEDWDKPDWGGYLEIVEYNKDNDTGVYW